MIFCMEVKSRSPTFLVTAKILDGSEGGYGDGRLVNQRGHLSPQARGV